MPETAKRYGLEINDFVDEDVAFNFKEFFRVDETETFIHKKEVDNFLLKILREFAINEDIETPVELNLKTRLMGSKALFDSMDLVSFIVEVEENLNEKFNLNFLKRIFTC